MSAKVALKLCVLVCIFYNSQALSFVHRSLVPPQKFDKGSCTFQPNVRNSFMKKSACKPRETMTELIPDAPNFIMLPSKVPVKRCDGGTCYGKPSCMPKKTEMIKIPVKKYNIVDKKTSCGFVHLEQHVQCECGCRIKANHCTDDQIYSKKDCSCMCANKKEEEECIKSGRIWDQYKCSCGCFEMSPLCSSGTEWVPATCSCMRVMTGEDNLSF